MVLGFFRKKDKQKLKKKNTQELKEGIQSNAQTQEQFTKMAQNTLDMQNMNAADYNARAKELGDENWNQAYRRDILGKNIEENTQKVENNAQNLNNRAVTNDTTPNDKILGTNQGNTAQASQEEQKIIQSQKIPQQVSIEQNTKDISTEKKPIATIDYDNWNVQSWKERGSNLDEFENAVEKKYNTVLTKNEDGSFSGNIGGTEYKWTFDSSGNPQKTMVAQNNSTAIQGELEQMFANNATNEQINEYVQQHKSDIDPHALNALVKERIKLQNSQQFTQKYQSLTPIQIHEKVKSGELVPGTDKFNALPNAQAYYNQMGELLSIDATKKTDYEAFNANMLGDSIDKITENITSKYFSTKEIGTLLDGYRNNTTIQSAESKIYDYQNQMVEIDSQIAKISDEVDEEFAGASAGAIAMEKARRQTKLMQQKKDIAGFINSEAGRISLERDNLQTELGLIQYHDQMKMKQYTNGLALYKGEQARIDALKQVQQEYQREQKKWDREDEIWEREKKWELKKWELSEQSNEIAFNRQKEWNKYQMQWEEEHKGGTYHVGVDGSLNYVVDGKSTPVNFGNGKTLFTENRKDYTATYKDNEDGTYSKVELWNNGKLNVSTYNMDGYQVSGLPDRIFGAIDKIPSKGKQCGTAVNDYLNNLGVKGRFFDSPWWQKKSKINSKTPMVGGIAIWNPASVGSKNHKYGHVAIVTGVSPDGQTVTITDWNSDGTNETKNTREIPVSQIAEDTDGGGFHNPSFMKGILKDYANTQTKSESNSIVGNFSEEILAAAKRIKTGGGKLSDYPQEERGQITLAMEKMQKAGNFDAKSGDAMVAREEKMLRTLDWLLDEKQNGTRESATGKMNWSWTNWWAGDRDDYLAEMSFLLDNETLTALANAKANNITFGALSGTELATVQQAASKLNGMANRDSNGKITGFSGGENTFKQELIHIREAYQKALKKKLGKNYNLDANDVEF